jgi:hypothetical protein
MTTKIPAVTTEYINGPDQPKNIAMIRERIERLKTWIKESVAALKAKAAAAVEKLSSLFSADAQIAADRVIIPDGNVLTVGKRIVATGGHAHAPLFSLYNFFHN